MDAYRAYLNAKHRYDSAVKWVADLDVVQEGRPVYSATASGLELAMFPMRDGRPEFAPSQLVAEILEDIDFRTLAQAALARLKKNLDRLLIAAADDVTAIQAELAAAKAE